MRPTPTEHGQLLSGGFKESKSPGLWYQRKDPGGHLILYVDFRPPKNPHFPIPNIYVRQGGELVKKPDPSIYPDLAPFVAPAKDSKWKTPPPATPPKPPRAKAGDPGGAPIHPESPKGASTPDSPPRDPLDADLDILEEVAVRVLNRAQEGPLGDKQIDLGAAIVFLFERESGRRKP